MKRNTELIAPSVSFAPERFDALCDRFEKELQCDARPWIESYLDDVPPVARDSLFRELLILELDYRWRSGQSVDEAGYLRRFPGREEQVQRALREAVVYAFPHRRSSASNSVAPTGATSAESREQGSIPSTARRLGRYELLQMVGVGGFNYVWKARDLELDRIVAVKIPHERIADEVELERFMREARAAANLRHPGIVPIHEVARDRDVVFLVSEFIEGATLQECMSTASLTARAAVELVADAAEALDYAHLRGGVHRDVKPANILLDLKGRPHIADFGLAKRLEERSNHSTVDGSILGTPAYMSPELADGKGATADGRTDVYSLGVVLFQLLTEELPFRGSGATLLDRIRTEEAPSPQSLNQAVPLDLATICQKCLEKEPSRRYSTAGALAADLRCWLDHRPIKARRIGPAGRIYRWIRRHPAPSALLACLALAVAGGTVGITWQWRKAVAAQRQFALGKIDALFTASPDSVPVLLSDLETFRPVVQERLEQVLARSDSTAQEKRRVRMALLPTDPSHAASLVESLLEVEAEDFEVLRDVLRPYADYWREILWKVVADSSADPARRLRASCALAAYEPSDERWGSLSPQTAVQLADLAAKEAEEWAAFLTPVADKLLEPLSGPFKEVRPERRVSACQAICRLFRDRPEVLCPFVADAGRAQLRSLVGALRPHGAAAVSLLRDQLEACRGAGAARDKGSVNTALALMMLEAEEAVWPLFEHAPDPTVRTDVIHAVSQVQISIQRLLNRLTSESNVSARRALLLAVGEYGKGVIAPADYAPVRDRVLRLFEEDPDPGIHSAAQWTLQQWGEESAIERIRTKLTSTRPIGNRRWYVSPTGHTMAIVSVSQPGEKPYELAVSTTEATFAQLRRWNPKAAPLEAPEGKGWDFPGTWVSYWDAADYCRWLSEQEGIPESQRGYPKDPLPAGKGDFPPPSRSIAGFRLPTMEEWKISAAAGATTPLFFGRSEPLATKYAWWAVNTLDGWHAGGTLKPNDFGLFDVEGGVFEWTDSMPADQARSKPEKQPHFVGRNLHQYYMGSSKDATFLSLTSGDSPSFTVRSRKSTRLGIRPVRTVSLP